MEKSTKNRQRSGSLVNCVAYGMDSLPYSSAKTSKMAVNVSRPRTLSGSLIFEYNYSWYSVISSLISETHYHLHLIFEIEIATLGCMNN